MDGGSWTPPAKSQTMAKERDTWGETLTWLCSHLCGKSSWEPQAVCPPSQFHGLLFPVGHICILTGKYSRSWMHTDMKRVNKWERKEIKEDFF